MPFGHNGHRRMNDHAWLQLLLQEIMQERSFQCQLAAFLRIHLDGKVYFMCLVYKRHLILFGLSLFPLLWIFFKIKGTIGCIWYVCWVIVVRRAPKEDKYISKDELRYIQDCLGASPNSNSATLKHPWKEIFTSKAIYAICASHFAENWGFYTMLTQLPTFLAGFFLLWNVIIYKWRN